MYNHAWPVTWILTVTKRRARRGGEDIDTVKRGCYSAPWNKKKIGLLPNDLLEF